MPRNQIREPTITEAKGAVERPSITFSDVTFSDGSRISLSDDDIVVLVGPNNAGKSAALRELETLIGENVRLTVLHGASVVTNGTGKDVVDYMQLHSIEVGTGVKTQLHGYRYSINKSHIYSAWTSSRRMITPFFCIRIPTETRITESDPPNNIDLLSQAPQHPIHILQADDRVERRLSSYFRRAFGEDLIVYHAGGSKVPLFVGQMPVINAGEHRMSGGFLERLRDSCTPLRQQGDGMRSFVSVILNMLTFRTPSVILLDEPEAFLHPPQARLVGEFICREKPRGAQLFVSTHSSDVLQGMLSADSGALRIIRIQRDGEINRVSELDKEKTKEIAKDPLLTYSSVFQGIFHKRVFICESDSDCLFYNSILHLNSVSGDQRPDALFIHGGGKHRLGKLAGALRALDVPVSVIADIDILREKGLFADLFQLLGGDWEQIEQDWLAVKNAVETRKPRVTAADVTSQIRKILRGVTGSQEFPKDKKRLIEKAMTRDSGWDSVKHSGIYGLPHGQIRQRFERIDIACRCVGLWIVPVGELENFCPSIEANHGPAWAQCVLETRRIEDDPELAEARAFVRDIWLDGSVSTECSDPSGL